MKYFKHIFVLGIISLFIFLNTKTSFAKDVDLNITDDSNIQELINTTGSDNDTLVIKDGKEHNFTNINIENKNIKVTNGTLKWNNSTLKNGTITFDGETAKGSFNGGSITIEKNITNAGIKLQNKASIDVIEGITMQTYHTTIELDSEARIDEIKSGSFTNGKSRSDIAVVKLKNAEIGKISGGTFKSINGAALRLAEGTKVGEISGGTFDATNVDYAYIDEHISLKDGISNLLNPYSAIVMYVNDTTLTTKKAVIEKISGGGFSGYHAIFMRTGVAEGIEIGEISGGTFKNIPQNDKIIGYRSKVSYSPVINTATIYTTQQARIGTISGGYFESDSADVMHFTWLLNSLPRVGTEINKISGGTFIAKNYGRAIMLNSGDYKIGTIENGTFISANEKTYAIDGDGKIGEIKNGIFYGGIKTGNSNSEPTKLETNLNTSQSDIGSARYYHKEKEFAAVDESQMFLKGNFTYPKYTTEEGYTYSYIPSFYRYNYKEFKTNYGFFKHGNDNTLNEDGEYFFWAGSPLGYFDNTNKKASYSSQNNNWYDDEKNGNYDRKEERIYSLYPTLENKNVKDAFLDVKISDDITHKMAYFRKRPILSFNANLPDNIKFTGSIPKRQHIAPFAWDNLGNAIEYDTQGKHWNQVFLVPTDPGITVTSDEFEYKFAGWNTKPDGSGRNLKLDKFYAMPLEDVTLYAKWDVKPKQNLTPEQPQAEINPKQTISGTIDWQDDLNQDGIRPKEVKLYLYNGDTKTEYETTAIEPSNKSGKWTYTFKDVTLQDSLGQKINYIVQQEKVEGYETTINNYDIVNKHVPLTKLITVNIKWVNDNKDIRPDSVKLTLVEDQDDTDTNVYQISKDIDTTTILFKDKAVNKNGQPITYTAKQVGIVGYKTEYSITKDTITIINTYEKVRLPENDKQDEDVTQTQPPKPIDETPKPDNSSTPPTTNNQTDNNSSATNPLPQPKPEPKPEVKPEAKVITHNPNWQQDLRKHNEFINKTQHKTSLPNTGYVSNHSILLASTLLTLVAYKLYKKED